jgi:hypothetical protein
LQEIQRLSLGHRFVSIPTSTSNQKIRLIPNYHAAEIFHILVRQRCIVPELSPPLREHFHRVGYIHVEHKNSSISASKERAGKAGESFLSGSILKQQGKMLAFR